MRRTISITTFYETRKVWQILRCQQSTVSVQNTVVITIHHGTRKVWQIFRSPRESKVARRNTTSLDHRTKWNPDSKTDFRNSPSLVKKNPESETDFQTWTVASNNSKNSCNYWWTWNPENMPDIQKSSTVESGKKKHSQSRSPINMKPGL